MYTLPQEVRYAYIRPLDIQDQYFAQEAYPNPGGDDTEPYWGTEKVDRGSLGAVGRKVLNLMYFPLILKIA